MTDNKETPDPARTASGLAVNVAATEERLGVDVAEQETATVRVRTIIHRELTEIPLVLKRRVVTIERVPVDRFVDNEFDPFQDGSTLVVPVFEHVPVTEMRLKLKEEVRIGFEETEETSVQPKCNGRSSW